MISFILWHNLNSLKSSFFLFSPVNIILHSLSVEVWALGSSVHDCSTVSFSIQGHFCFHNVPGIIVIFKSRSFPDGTAWWIQIRWYLYSAFIIPLTLTGSPTAILTLRAHLSRLQQTVDGWTEDILKKGSFKPYVRTMLPVDELACPRNSVRSMSLLCPVLLCFTSWSTSWTVFNYRPFLSPNCFLQLLISPNAPTPPEFSNGHFKYLFHTMTCKSI